MWQGAKARIVLLLQVHGSSDEATAAAEGVKWKDFLSLTWDACRRPMLWFYSLVGFLWGKLRHEEYCASRWIFHIPGSRIQLPHPFQHRVQVDSVQICADGRRPLMTGQCMQKLLRDRMASDRLYAGGGIPVCSAVYLEPQLLDGHHHQEHVGGDCSGQQHK